MNITYGCFVDVELERTFSSVDNVWNIIAVKYSLSKEPQRSLSRDTEDFQLLVDALSKLPQSILNNSM